VAGAVANGLRQRGVDILTTQEAGMLGATDDEHLTFATHSDRVIFTQDRDFLRLHSQVIQHKGIVYASKQTSVGEIIRGLMLIYQVLDAGEMENKLEFL